MPLNKPDILQHNNPNNAIADSNFLRGGGRIVANLNELYQIASGVNTKVDQLKQNITRVYVTGEDRYYLLKDIANASGANGWKLDNYVHLTGDQSISGVKNFTNLLTSNEFKMYDIDVFQVSGVDVNIINGTVNFNIRPTVNGSGVVLSGEGGAGGPPPCPACIYDNIIFDGKRTISRPSFPYNEVLNQTTTTGVVEFLNEVFYPSVPISISLYDYSIKEAGVPYQIAVSGTINANSEGDATLGIAVVKQNGVDIYTELSPNSGYFNYTSSTSVSSDTSVEVKLTYSKNGETKNISQSADINFEYPFYFSSGSATALDFNNIIYVSGNINYGLRPGLVKKIETKQDKSFAFTTTGEYIYVIFPQNWGLFSSIKDKNSLENIGGWTYKTYSSTHYIWQSNNISSGSNINLTFKY
jgi:hypothetical protein